MIRRGQTIILIILYNFKIFLIFLLLQSISNTSRIFCSLLTCQTSINIIYFCCNGIFLTSFFCSYNSSDYFSRRACNQNFPNGNIYNFCQKQFAKLRHKVYYTEQTDICYGHLSYRFLISSAGLVYLASRRSLYVANCFIEGKE